MTTATAEHGIMADMSPLEFQRPAGKRARQSILRLLAEAEQRGERATITSLAAAMPISAAAWQRHVAVMAEAGLVEIKRGRGGGVYLTDGGRLAIC